MERVEQQVFFLLLFFFGWRVGRGGWGWRVGRGEEGGERRVGRGEEGGGGGYGAWQLPQASSESRHN